MAVGENLTCWPSKWRFVTPSILPLMEPRGLFSAQPIRLSKKTSTVVKKKHTVKNNLIGDIEDRLVRYLSETYPGRIHDKRICDNEEPVFPPGCGLFKDTGFQGYEPEGVETYQPKKKPKGKELTSEEKSENKIISSKCLCTIIFIYSVR